MNYALCEVEGLVVLDEHELQQVNGDGIGLYVTGIVLLGLVSMAVGAYNGYKNKADEVDED